MPHRFLASIVVLSLTVVAGTVETIPNAAQPVPTDLLAAASGGLRYRMIGPHRGGRTKAAVGVPESRPFELFSVMPGGSAPPVTDHDVAAAGLSVVS